MAIEAPQPPKYPLDESKQRLTPTQRANVDYAESRPPFAASLEQMKAYYDLADKEAIVRDLWQIDKNKEGREMFDSVDAARKAQQVYIDDPNTPYIERALKTNPLVQNLLGTPYYNEQTQRNEYRRADGFLDGLYNGMALGYGAITGKPEWKREQDSLTQANQAKLSAERWQRAKDVYNGKEPQPITPPSVAMGEKIYPIMLQNAGKNPTDLTPEELLQLEKYRDAKDLFLQQYRSYLSREDSLANEQRKRELDIANAHYLIQSFLNNDMSAIVDAAGDVTSTFNRNLTSVDNALAKNIAAYKEGRLADDYAKMYASTFSAYNALGKARDFIKSKNQNLASAFGPSWIAGNDFKNLYEDPSKTVFDKGGNPVKVGKTSFSTLFPTSYKTDESGNFVDENGQRVPLNYFETPEGQKFIDVFKSYRTLYSAFSNFMPEDGSLPPLLRTYLSKVFTEGNYKGLLNDFNTSDYTGSVITDLNGLSYDDYLKRISNSIINNPNFAE